MAKKGVGARTGEKRERKGANRRHVKLLEYLPGINCRDVTVIADLISLITS